MTEIIRNNGENILVEANDDIELKHILRAFWNTRKIVVGSVLVAAILLAGIILALRLSLPSEQIFQHRIVFTFEGAKEQKYPNGAPFAISDLLAPVVLKKVFDDNGLSEQGVSLEDFIAGVSINPFSPTYNLVAARYLARLSNKKLSFTERVEIEKAMQDELDSLQNRSALIRLQLIDHVGISNELGQKIVQAIPAAWAKISIEQLGVLELADGFDSGTLIDKNLFASLDYLPAIDLLLRSVNRLEKRIKTIQKIDGSATVVDEKSKQTLSSLKRTISDFNIFKVQELLLIATEFVISESPERTALYFKNKLERLIQRQKTFKVKAESTKMVMRDYVNENGNQGTAGASDGNGGVSGIGGATTIAQFGEAFLDKIVKLTEQSSDQKFRQEMTSARLDYIGKEIDMNAEIALTKKIVSKLSNPDSTISSLAPEEVARNKKYVKDNTMEIAAELNRLWAVAGEIQSRLSFKKLSYSGKLYKNTVLKSSETVINNHPVFNMRIAILYFVALILIGILALVVGLMSQAMQARRGAATDE